MGDVLAPCPSGSTLAVGVTGPWAEAWLPSKQVQRPVHLPEPSAPYWFTEGSQTGKVAFQQRQILNHADINFLCPLAVVWLTVQTGKGFRNAN